MLSTFETMLGRPRCRTWIPLATQQLRLRHLIRVIAYNIKSTEGSLYYTLHFTSMSAPFYTSEKLESQNPKWAELDINTLQFSSASSVVLRIWHHLDSNQNDTVLLAWGICLSGLVYLGTKLADIQPVSFKANSVIFQLNGGYFTSVHCIRSDTSKPVPFKEHLNIIKNGETTSIVRNATINCAKSDVRLSYNVKKLQRLHSLQQSIKNKSLDAQDLQQKINAKCGLIEGISDSSDPLRDSSSISTSTSLSHSSSRLLSMTSLNRMLNNKQDQPTRVQRQEIVRIRKLIESARFRTKLLSQERDRKLANIRRLNQECNLLLDNNEDKNSELMSLYRQLSRDVEKLRDFCRSQAANRESYVHTTAQLNLRRKQLVNQLLLIYPIIKNDDNKFTISDVHLPDSECLHLVPDSSLSVALGFVTHVVVMCSTFLQVPLRYPLIHIGSRSKIIDHVITNIPEREREFPLYTKGKDRVKFQYAVYLLNKNIAQLRWYCGLPTQDLRATLSNLLNLLQENFDYRFDRPDSVLESLPRRYGSYSTLERSSFSDKIMFSSPISTSCDQIFSGELTPIRKVPKTIRSESGPGLSQILAVPVRPQRFHLDLDAKREHRDKASSTLSINKIPANNCVDFNNIEQGLDLLYDHSLHHQLKIVEQRKVPTSTAEVHANGTEPLDLAIKLQRRISRSVGSYTESEDKFTLSRSNNLEVGSDSLLISAGNQVDSHLSDEQSLPNSLGEGRNEFLQHWFNSNPTLVCPEEHLCPEEFLGSVVAQGDGQSCSDEVVGENALTMRTEALVDQNSTFHLVKPKH